MIQYKRVKAYNKGMLNTNYRNFEELKISTFARDFRNENKMTRKSTAYWMNFNPKDTEHFGYLGRVPTVTKVNTFSKPNNSKQLKRARTLTKELYNKEYAKNSNATFENGIITIDNSENAEAMANFKKAMAVGELAYKEALLQG